MCQAGECEQEGNEKNRRRAQKAEEGQEEEEKEERQGQRKHSHTCMPVRTRATTMYKTVTTSNVPTMPMGRSLSGRFTSPAKVDTLSKPIYEKNTLPTPAHVPERGEREGGEREEKGGR